jgi:hypothetical protein
MSSKTFKNVRKPARQPTAEEIAGFEATGRAGRKLDPAALATETRKSASTETLLSGDAEPREAVNPDSRKAASPQTREPVSTEVREHAKAETCNPVSPEIPEPANTEISIPAESVVRLTIDLPESTHLRFKAACALSRRTMVQEVRDFIERRTVELEDRRRLN